MKYLVLTVQIVTTEFLSDKTLSVSIVLPHVTPPPPPPSSKSSIGLIVFNLTEYLVLAVQIVATSFCWIGPSQWVLS